MTVLSSAAPPRVIAVPSSNPLLGFFLEVCVLAKRYLIHLRRQPQQLMFATAQPALFVLMFRFVFGGAIKIGAGATNYASYLMPGIFIQSVTLGAMTIGVRLAEDMHSGLIDRFRSLPISRAAVLTGHTTAGLLRNLFVVCIVFVVGLAVGFRPALDPLGWLAAIALILGFTFAISWVAVTIALYVSNLEAVEMAGLTLLMPLTFVSSAFVPTQSMPGPLRWFAEHQPVSVVIDAVRPLFLGTDPGPYPYLALLWIVGIVAVFSPLAVRGYLRATSK
ncbi:ABC transporter permease [Fodinicola feengrottensis]|uniref:Transport permease protein n=1 Tax=Fodinicola feengrottensis TaxID=435914 RepID=A0ABN2I8W1_9ACTN